MNTSYRRCLHCGRSICGLYHCRGCFRRLGLSGPRSTPRRPADGLPGSETKIAELQARALARQTLWRDDDLQRDLS